MPSRLSEAMEDYLKAIFHLEDEGLPVATGTLAERLGVAAPSVTNMLKRLQGVGLVSHSPYREVELTPAGRAVALEVVRHHRLIELYLAEFLDVPWDKVHEEAERLEHVISEELESRLAEKLGQPDFDPHGHPIPSYEGTVSEPVTVSLWDVAPGGRVVVARVSDRDPGLLAYLPTLDLVPGADVQVIEVSPYADVQTIEVGDRRHAIGSALSRAVRVRPSQDSTDEGSE